MGVENFLDLEEQYAFYAAYHSHPINVLIHMLFVWPILFTFSILLAYSGPLLPTPAFLSQLPGGSAIVFNFAFVIGLIYAIFYIILDKRAGSLAAFMVLLAWIGATASYDAMGAALAWKVAVGINVFCWIAQFLGHFVFEGRAPALFDNLVQAFLMAPFFVLLEVLERVFDYEPSSGFRLRVQGLVQVALTEMRMKKQM